MKTKHDITPGQDKFLRLHIDDLSQPIRRSNYHPTSTMPGERASLAFGVFCGVSAILVVIAIIVR